MRTRTNYLAEPTILPIDIKGSVRVATAAALAANTRVGNVLTANANASINTAGIDGITTLAVGDRILIKDEVTGANRGIYTITSLGAAGAPCIFTRSADADSSAKVTNGLFTFVEEGTVNGSGGFVLTTANPIVLNTTSLTFTQFTGAGQVVAGTNVTKTGNTLSVTGSLTAVNGITSTAGQNLLLGTGTFGTAVTIASATGKMTLPDTLTINTALSILNGRNAGTAQSYTDITNTGNQVLSGVDSSAGALTGNAYAAFFGSFSNRAAAIMQNGALAALWDTSKHLTLSGVAKIKEYTVAALPAAATYAYSHAFVTDATLTSITGLGLAVTGGGANKVPVYSDGTNWIIL